MALTDQRVSSFRRELLLWYAQNARDLPWRRTRDPYRIWVSEVMLQQTRVAAVIGRYTTFIERYPSLVSLALVNQEDVLALWSGLGYYRRARMLHSAAQLLVREHEGSLPKSFTELRALPGVGDYTAAAIASIAHGEPVAVVDGNVERVLTRVLGKSAADKHLSAGHLKAAATRFLDTNSPGAFNQAMMELGATVCLPQLPLCASCPVREFCQTRGEHAARPRKQMRSRKIDYALVRKPVEGNAHALTVLLVQRPKDASQMPGMWELPVLAAGKETGCEPILRARHSITNINYYVGVYEMESGDALEPSDSERRDWVPTRDLGEIPLTGLARKILMRLEVFARPREVRRGKDLPGLRSAMY
ncbi:MAG: A/G-specific adenine glycosylase [Acidobacteriaceae bacterium]